MIASTSMLAFLQNLGMPELIVIGIIALVLFGRRLPEVGRSLGKGIVEFKKGLREVEDDVNDASRPAGKPGGGTNVSSNNTTLPGAGG
jgi:sec-independent protein translocase protein TatA